ncbi:MAG TPA: TonB-dependent receptor, partial [Nevskiaceae bacterium]|nr:TonB-dependent receptor [Nevskiaceae bacterium]
RPRRSPSDLAYQFGDLKLAGNFDWAQLISDTGYVRKSSDTFFDASSRLPGNGQTPAQTAQIDYARSHTWSQELRLVSPDDSAHWQWVAGAAAFKQDVLFHEELPVSVALPLGLNQIEAALGPALNAIPGLAQQIDANGQALLALLETNAEIREYALFGDLTRRLGDSWEVSLGGRLYRTTSQGTARQEGLLLLAINQQPTHLIEGTLHEQGFNPKASLMWHAGRDLIAYVSASKGFRVGGVQPGYSASGPKAPDFFKSDTLWNYEAGLRTQWFDRQLRADITGFYVTWKNPQTFQLGSSGLSSYLDNAGGVKNHGIEAALQAVLPFGFLLNTSLCWTDTRTSKPFDSQGGEVAPGAQWPFAPHWQTASSLAWMLPLGNWTLAPSVNYSTLSHAPTTLDPSAVQFVFGYSQLDLQLSVNNASLPWMPEFALTLNNVRDKRGLVNRFDGGLVPGSGYTDVTYMRPRALTLHLAGHF